MMKICVLFALYPYFQLFSMLNNTQGAQTILHCVLQQNDSNLLTPGGYHAHCKPKRLSNNIEKIVTSKMDQLYDVSNDLWVE